MPHSSLFFVTICLIKTSLANHENSNEPYIHGGKNASIERFPWAAYVRTPTDACTGSIIGDQWVLTAGHCLLNKSKETVRVFVGTSIRGSGQRFQAESVHIPSLLSSACDPTIDIGIIKTKTKFVYSAKIFPVSLYPYAVVDTTARVEMAGFGMLDDTRRSVNFQGATGLRILPYNECKRMITGRPLSNFLTGPDSVLCTFSKKIALLDGDSGAGVVLPVASRKYLVAVFALSPAFSHAKKFPHFHAKVYRHLDWIKSISGIFPRK